MVKTTVCTQNRYGQHVAAQQCPPGQYVSKICASNTETTCTKPGSNDSSYCIECTSLPGNVEFMNIDWKHATKRGQMVTCDKDELLTGVCMSGNREDCCQKNRLDENSNCVSGTTSLSLACTKVAPKQADGGASVLTSDGQYAMPQAWCRSKYSCNVGSSYVTSHRVDANSSNMKSDATTLKMDSVTSSDSSYPIVGCSNGSYMQGVCKTIGGDTCSRNNFQSNGQPTPDSSVFSDPQSLYAMCHSFSDNAFQRGSTPTKDEPGTGSSNVVPMVCVGFMGFIVLYGTLRSNQRHSEI